MSVQTPSAPYVFWIQAAGKRRSLQIGSRGALSPSLHTTKRLAALRDRCALFRAGSTREVQKGVNPHKGSLCLCAPGRARVGTSRHSRASRIPRSAFPVRALDRKALKSGGSLPAWSCHRPHPKSESRNPGEGAQTTRRKFARSPSGTPQHGLVGG